LNPRLGSGRGLPGFPRAAVSRCIALYMEKTGLTNWRFEPTAETGPAPDRVEWSFKLNPYAGGEVRRFASDERHVHAHRSVTIEARLYLNGQYQALVKSVVGRCNANQLRVREPMGAPV
jgi:hypothetical protein